MEAMSIELQSIWAISPPNNGEPARHITTVQRHPANQALLQFPTTTQPMHISGILHGGKPSLDSFNYMHQIHYHKFISLHARKTL